MGELEARNGMKSNRIYANVFFTDSPEWVTLKPLKWTSDDWLGCHCLPLQGSWLIPVPQQFFPLVPPLFGECLGHPLAVRSPSV